MKPEDDFTALSNIAVQTEMTKLLIDEDIIHKKLSELKLDKSPGPTIFILGFSLNSIMRFVNHLKLFDLSLQTGKTPTDWRSAVITALHKKGNKAHVSNYRSVSLMSVICKVM